MSSLLVDFKIMSWNVHSLRRRFIDLLYSVRQEKPDAVCLQEALHGHNKFQISGYTKYEHDTQQGLVTYISNKIPHEFVENSIALNNNDGNTYMLLKINLNNDPFYICNTYIEINKFDETKLPNPLIFEDIIFAGDINAKHVTLAPPSHPHTNTNGRRLIPFINENNMTVLGPKEGTHLRGGRLDYFIYGGLKEAEFGFRKLNLLLSDHYAIECTVSLKVESYIPHERLRIHIPIELVAPFRAFMSKIFHGFNVDALTSQEIYDIIATNIQIFHDNFAKNELYIANNNKSDWTNDPTLKDYEHKVKLAFEEYEKSGDANDLKEILTELRQFSNLKSDVRIKNFENFLSSLTSQTSEAKIWQAYNRLIGKRKSVKQTKNAKTLSQSLLDQYSLTSTFSNLPHDIQVRLDERRFDRLMKIEIACAETNEEDRFINEITKFEIDLALSNGKSTAPGEDGITYQVIRYLNDDICDGINPVQLLFTSIYREGSMPWQWKHSMIIPIPKPGSDKLRPISLTSCFCKVFERIILNRLKYSLNGKLSSNLYGFVNGKSTNDCFLEFMAADPTLNVTVFLDIKSAFETANHTIILEHLVTLGIKGELLQIIRDYFTDRYSKVYYKGYLTPEAKKFELGTPQGGVLSPFLFNILMDKMLKSITLPSNMCKIICYADDVCIRTATPADMQNILDQITDVAKDIGLMISIPKTKFLSTKSENIQLSLNNAPIELCSDYRYLGIPVPPPANYIKDLCEKLSQRLRPLKMLANKIAGVSIKLCRLFYVSYIRSLVVYNALYLSTYNAHELKPLETIQNKAMRIILGCPSSTRIILMQQELDLPPIADYIFQVATLAGIKIAKSQILENDPQVSAPLALRYLIKGEIPFDRKVHPKIFKVIAIQARMQNVNVFPEIDEVETDINPSKRVAVKIHIPKLPSASEIDSRNKKNLWLEALGIILEENFENGTPLHIYTDGSLKTCTGGAGCGLVIYEGPELIEIHSESSSLPNWTSNLESELTAIKKGVKFAVENRKNALVISDSIGALQSINSHQTQYKNLVNNINKNIIECVEMGVEIQFMWVPSHVGITGNEKADLKAKEGSDKPNPAKEVLSVSQFRTLIRNDILERRQLILESEKLASITIKHHEKFRSVPHLYGKGSVYSGACDRIAARIRIGYRHPWQIARDKNGEIRSEYSKCVLCMQENSNCLDHYVLTCPKLGLFRPEQMKYHELCLHFCKPEILIPILTLFPGFKM